MRPLDKETKEAQGTFEPSKEGFQPVSYDNFERGPYVPDRWPVEAQTIWRDIWDLLRKAGNMSKSNILSVRALAWAAHRRQWAETQLIEDPYDLKAEKIQESNTKVMMSICANFGFTPADLYRVPAVKKDDAKTMSLLK